MKKDLDFLAGQIDAQRLALSALIAITPGRARFLEAFRLLHKGEEDRLLVRPVPGAQIAGFVAERDSLEALFRPDGP